MKTRGLGGGGGEDWPGSSRSISKNLRRAHFFLVYFSCLGWEMRSEKWEEEKEECDAEMIKREMNEWM